jgi:hypothetical protein
VRAYALGVREAGGGPPIALLDYTQWVLLLESSNVARAPIWTQEYSALRAYGLADMSAQSWLDALARMREPRSIELARYVAHANVWDQGRERFGSADAARSMLCGARHVDADAFASCRDDALGDGGAPPTARQGDLLPSASSREEEGVSAVWAMLPRGVTATG